MPEFHVYRYNSKISSHRGKNVSTKNVTDTISPNVTLMKRHGSRGNSHVILYDEIHASKMERFYYGKLLRVDHRTTY